MPTKQFIDAAITLR